jgi:hypothetical protein
MNSHLKFSQINLQHAKSASAVISRSFELKQTDLILIQEPYFFKGVKGLGASGALYCVNSETSKTRACIYGRKDLNLTFLPQLSNCDFAACLLKYKKGNNEKSIIVCSAYLPYDTSVPTTELINAVQYSKRIKIPILIGSDANSHNIMWGSSDTNRRGISLMEFILSEDLRILNEGNRPTFINRVREEVIDITFCSSDIEFEISDWRVSSEDSLSDHQTINFKMFADPPPPISYRNPKATNWEAFNFRLDRRLRNRNSNITTIAELENESDVISNAIVQSYKESCPLKTASSKSANPWWNDELLNLTKS